jgi:hypothetical protein
LLAFSESSLRYDVKHSKKSVIGICGIDKVFWADELRENGIKINSLSACEYVLNYYLEQNSGNKKKALAAYKGLKKDVKVNKVVDNMIKIEKKIEGELK